MWGRKGGESPPVWWDEKDEDFWEIPKSLPTGLRGKPPEWAMLILWMMLLSWEEARRREAGGQSPTDFYVVVSTETLAQETELEGATVATALRQMAEHGWVQKVSEGWRLVRWSDPPGSP
jgi:hypothetical protein